MENANDFKIMNNSSVKLNAMEENKKDRTAKIIKNILVYTFLTVVAVASFFPFYWMIITSLKAEEDFRQSVPSFFPDKAYGGVHFENYSNVLAGRNSIFGQILFNTILVGGISTFLSIVVTILTAYALARMNFKGKSLLFTLMLGTMMIPGEMFTVTNYVTVSKNFHWANTYVVLIVPFLVSIYYIYLLRNAFMQIPETLYKAAKVDGITDMGYLVKVMVPLTAPTLISITLLKFIGTWNSYIWPRLVNKQKSWRLLSNWVSGGFQIPGTSEPSSTLKMAAACIAAIPLFLLFVFFRKYIMHGVSKSGTKG